MSGGPQPRPRRTWPQRLILGFNMMIVGLAILAAVVLAYAKETVSGIGRISFGDMLAAEDSPASADGTEDEGDQPDEDLKPPLNFLLVGVDSIANLPAEHILRQTRGGTQLTDTLIVFRVDPNTGAASAMSIPRDLWVPIDGGAEDKINSALAFSGETGLVATVQNELDIPIHRYIQVDFNGFLELMRTIGGIDVFIEYPLRDRKAQFEVLQTGCVNLTPDQALGYVRSRTLQALVDGEWRLVDARSDLGRIDRQQDFLVLALNKAFSAGLTNPATLKGIVDNVTSFVTLDDRLTPQELVELAEDFRAFSGDELERLTLPVVVGTAGSRSVVRLVEGEAQEVLAVFRGEKEQTPRVRIAILNGTGVAGVASEVELVVNERGFNVVDTDNADSFGYDETVIRFDPSQAADAEVLERWLVNGAVLEPRDEEGGGPMELIVGTDYEGLLETPRPAPTPEGSTELEITDPTPGAETPQPTPTPQPSRLATIRGC